MEIFEHFRAVATILEESIKLLPKNGRFMAFIALLAAILYSSLSLFLNFSTKSLFSDMLIKHYMNSYPSSSNYGSSNIPNPYDGSMKDLQLLLAVDISFIIGIYIVSLFTTIAVVIVSASSYNSKTLSGKDLMLQIVRSWIRPLITSFYTMLLAMGYLLVFIILATPLWMLSKTHMLSIIMVSGTIAYIFYLYLTVVWILALVVSVLEENSYGIQALGRAWVLLEGKKLQGFILNISLSLLSFILHKGFQIIVGKKVMANQTLFWISSSIFLCLMKILQIAAYTVLYFHRKKELGEEMELQGSVSYQKLSLEPAFSDAV